MNRKLRVVTALLALSLLFTGIAGMANAADTGVVAATVTLQNISVTVADGSVAYGVLAANTTRTTLAAGLNDQQTATNNGNQAESFNIKSQNSANWTLAGTAGVDTFVHKFCIATCGTEGTPGGGFTAMTTGYQSLQSNVAQSGTRTFDLLVNTPTSSATYTSQSIDVTVQAVAFP